MWMEVAQKVGKCRELINDLNVHIGKGVIRDHP